MARALSPGHGLPLARGEPSSGIKEAEGSGFRRGLAAGRRESADEIARLRSLLAGIDAMAGRVQSDILLLRITAATADSVAVPNTESGRPPRRRLTG